MQRLILIILSTFVFLATPALAKGSAAAMWIVSQRSGDARVVRSGLQPAALTANATLAPGDIIMTGTTGRATLARGSDYIVVAPRSELRLPATSQPTGFTRVIQTLGTMLFKVRHTGVPHFAVDTPMLAAVVKGTTFTIVVDKDRSAVQVIEGAVQVTATDGGMHELVEGGRTVFIDRTHPKRLIVADARTLGTSGPSTDTSVKINGSEGESLTTVAALTSGLVRAEAVPVPKAESPAIVGAVVATTAATNDSGSLIQPTPAATVDGATAAAAPVVTPIVDAAVAPVVAPIVNTVVVPVVAPVVAVVAPVVAPVVAVVAPVVAPVVAVVAPVVAPVVAVVAPVVAPVVAVVAPVVAPVVAVVAPVVAVVAPVVAPILAPLAPVVAPILAPLAPVVAPVTGILGGLFGG